MATTIWMDGTGTGAELVWVEFPRGICPGAVPIADNGGGGWCSDVPRPLPRRLGSWLDFEVADCDVPCGGYTEL